MSGIGSVLDMGKKALLVNQSAIRVVSNNVANANTPGYRRQAVRLEESMAIDYAPGQMGTGVSAKEVYRYFDAFIEDQYNTKASQREMWMTMHYNLSNVEILFNESMGTGVNELMAGFWSDWQNLSNRPEDMNARSVLIANTNNLTNAINQLNNDLARIQSQADDFIQQDVDRLNEIVKEIAEINRHINAQEVPGRNNLNEMRDKRDLLVRELAEIIDINYIDNGGGNVTITTKAGHTLVESGHSYEIKFENRKIFNNLTPGSTFTDQIYFEGSSSYEYTIKVVHEGMGIGHADDPTLFKVSLDGGLTWIKDANGNETFEAQGYDNRVTLPVDGVSIWFGSKDDPTQPPASALKQNDEFQIIPKTGLYWYENSSSPMNITPQVLNSGQMNDRRVTGGSLAGHFIFRDHYAGKYQEKLDATAKALIWEVNRIHTQGAGLANFTEATGTYQVTNPNEALGSASSGLFFGDMLQRGNFTIHIYDKDTGEHTAEVPDFGPGGFNPEEHSLEDVRAAIDAINGLSARIFNSQLVIEADDGNEIAFGNDTSGLLAGLGINTFFQGEGARDLAVNDFVGNNIAHINAGHVNGAGEINSGDNQMALDIAGLQYKKVSITTSFEGTTTQTIQEYYNSLVGNVGADTNMSMFNAQYNKALADDLNRRQEEISGVNLDEEMSSLIKFQHSYQAAAKLISTAQMMMQTLIGMKS
ncbi:flagellar hook-associated protein FlgK [Desulfonatronovibrio hydrogenovorans]|uniref:flagellar hook-associated protein FlgK n=1 Tax=Desulfonatronovibrio hydrogenovorans TaxID=53245 RepID=UPI000491B09B|nr:flagellar hook-associated protein FlgK [Desulfonatronovibrio hydrogenovorans]